jgi:predicted aldo/keto reductase-like oxidoreductase
MLTQELSLPRLGFGLMRLPMLPAPEETAVDIPQLCEMVDLYMQSGMNYFDTAYMYCGGESERAIGQALVRRYPREAYYLTTKLPQWMMQSIEDRDKILNDQLERTGAGYFDLYLLHSVEDGANYEGYVKYDAFRWALEKKRREKSAILDFPTTAHPNCWNKFYRRIPKWRLCKFN